MIYRWVAFYPDSHRNIRAGLYGEFLVRNRTEDAALASRHSYVGSIVIAFVTSNAVNFIRHAHSITLLFGLDNLRRNVAMFEKFVEHLRTLGTACGKLRVDICLREFELIKLVGDVQRGKDRYL